MGFGDFDKKKFAKIIL